MEIVTNPKRIIHNQLDTPDGEVLISRSRHDYETHQDANGKTYFLDGGHEYVRHSLNGDEVLKTLYEDEPLEVAREYMEWGTYGVNGDEPLHFLVLKDMTTTHIQAILKTLPTSNSYFKFFKEELKNRLEQDK